MEKTNDIPNLTNVSEIELVYRTKFKASLRPKVTDSSNVAALLKCHWNLDQIELLEEFKVLFLNQANSVLGILSLSKGGITGTVADPRLIFSAALKALACGIILAHSHPSGNLRPSKADEDLTCRLREAGRLLDIKVLDHLILSQESYFSFADAGLL